MAAPTLPTMGVLAIDNTASAYPGTDVAVQYGACTTDGTAQGTMIMLPNLIDKCKTNLFKPEYGKILGAYGRAPLGAFFGTQEIYFEGVSAAISGEIRAILRGGPGGEATSTGTPLFNHAIGISVGGTGAATAPVCKQWQIHFDVFGPKGQIRRVLLFRASFSITGEDEIDQGSSSPMGTAFRISAYHDNGAKIAGNDPIGYVYDTSQGA